MSRCVVFTPDRFERKRSHIGPIFALQLIDNANRHGMVSDPSYSSSEEQGVRDLLAMIEQDDEIEATMMGMAGEKGYDGYIYLVKQ